MRFTLLNNERILKIVGVAVLLFYLNASLNLQIIPNWLAFPFVMLSGPTLFLLVQHVFGKKFFNDDLRAKMRQGITLLGISFIVFTILSIVQQTGLIRYHSLGDQNLQSTFYLFNSIQLGFDLVFDVFYGLGILLISKILLDENIKCFSGWFGVITASALLLLNMFTFPEPPNTSGYIDFGPFTIIWWIVLVLEIKSNNYKTSYGKNFR